MRTKKFLSLLLSAAMALSLLTATAFAAAPAEEENGTVPRDDVVFEHTLG